MRFRWLLVTPMRSLTTSSNVYSDGWDSDFYGDDEDRKKLTSMNEVEREAVLYERSQARLLRNEQKMMKERLKERDNPKKTKNDLRKEKLEELKLKRKYSKETSNVFDARIEDGEVESPERKSKGFSAIDLDTINQLRISRNLVEKWIFHPKFDSLMENSLARIAISSSNNEQIYRLVKIIKVVKYHRTYSIGSAKTDKAALVCYGKSQKVFCFDIFSNGNFTEKEYSHWLDTLKSESISPINMDAALWKISEWKKLEQEPITEQVLSNMIQAKNESKKLSKNLLTEKAILLHKLQVASTSSDSLEKIDTLKQLEYIEKKRGEISSSSSNNLSEVYHKKKTAKPSKLSSMNKMKKSTIGEKDNLDPFSRRKCRPVNYNDFGEEIVAKNEDHLEKSTKDNDKEIHTSDHVEDIDLDI